MASQRQVELTIKVNNAKSLQDLEDVTKDINAELKTLDTNSEAFKKLSDTSQLATGKLKSVKEQLAGISDSRQLDSVAKLGGALASSFSIAAVASSAFGKQSQEQILKTIQTAQQLSVVVQGIKPIIEGLNSVNLKAFSAWINGFKQSAVYAELFGTTTRAALTATGIGVFIALLGTMVVYWQNVSNATEEAAEALKKYNQQSEENFQKRLTFYNTEIGTIRNNASQQIALLEVQGSKEAEIFDARTKALKEQIKLAEVLVAAAQRAFDQSPIGSSAEELKRLKEARAILAELQSEINVITAQYAKFNAEQSKKEADEAQKKRIAGYAAEIDEITRRNKELSETVLFGDEQAKQIEDGGKRIAEIQKQAYDEVSKSIKENQESELQISEQQAYDIAAQKVIFERDANALKLEAQIEYYEQLGQLTEEQEEILAGLKKEKNQEVIDSITTYASYAAGQISQLAQAIGDSYNATIENANTQIDSIDARFKESSAEREALEAQLFDAQGQRREAILASIEEERKKEKALAAERKKAENEKIKAQNKQNEVNYINSIIQATISTAQAVVQALNFPPPASFIFAALAAVLGGVQIGVISSNKPAEIPLQKASGGFTGTGSIKDSTGERKTQLVQLHENEWVAPRWMTESPAIGQQIAELEAIRQRGIAPMAEGGYATFSAEALPVQAIDYSSINQVTNDSIVAAMNNVKIYTSWTEGREVGNNVEFIESNASL